ncbi:MAG: hypothetical protein HYV07_19185 [Deltaproteobacteria bacterium]|nr:hypothetical protein [Deltaproteobacteria bacterium]
MNDDASGRSDSGWPRAPGPAEDELRASLEALGRKEVSAADVLGMSPEILDRLLAQAIGLVALGHLDSAEPLLAGLARASATNPRPSFVLAALRAKRGAHLEALEAYAQALLAAAQLGDEPTRQHVLFCRAQSLVAVGDRAHAVLDLIEASKGPDPNVCQDANGWLKELT